MYFTVPCIKSRARLGVIRSRKKDFIYFRKSALLTFPASKWRKKLNKKFTDFLLREKRS